MTIQIKRDKKEIVNFIGSYAIPTIGPKHSLEAINAKLKKTGMTAEKSKDYFGKTAYYMFEQKDENGGHPSHGIYYKKSDLVDAVNEVLK